MTRRPPRSPLFPSPTLFRSLERIAEARILIDEARLLTLNAAYRMDTAGNKAARAEIAMIKVAAPDMLCTVLDWAIQDRKSTRLNSSHLVISYAVFCLKKKKA